MKDCILHAFSYVTKNIEPHREISTQNAEVKASTYSPSSIQVWQFSLSLFEKKNNERKKKDKEIKKLRGNHDCIIISLSTLPLYVK